MPQPVFKTGDAADTMPANNGKERWNVFILMRNFFRLVIRTGKSAGEQYLSHKEKEGEDYAQGTRTVWG